MTYLEAKEHCERQENCQVCSYSIPIYEEKNEDGTYKRICDILIDE